MTENNPPSAEESRRLFELMGQIKTLAPWDWMEEADLFGVQNPENDELGFISVMGMAGEHFGISVYLGARALYSFWDLEDDPFTMNPELLLQIPQLQASFEDRADLGKRDLDLIKSLNLKFRGKKAWPMLQSYRPGYAPWYLESHEARFLGHVLEQLLDVAPRFQANPELLDPTNDEHYLVRTPMRQGDTLHWEDRRVLVPPPPPLELQITIDPKRVKALTKARRANNRLEVDFSMLPMPVVDERGARPVFPYMLLIVEARSGMVLGQELLTVETTLEALWASIPGYFLKNLARLKMIPHTVNVQSSLMLSLLQPVADALDVELVQLDSLPNAGNVRAMLSGFMGNAPF
ncbi:MAG TPA: hypothetical protein VMT34_00555 [Aggregatilineales bacterium]|nr:hypothetical protein [Aggregatilineales bacterium]